MFVILRLVKFTDPKDFNSEIDFQEFITLKPEGEAIIGRSRSCMARLPDDYCSSEHCEIYFSGNELFIKDLKSKNGTKVNGIKIDEKIQIYIKDIIVLGSTFIHIDEDRSPKNVVAKLKRPEDGTIAIKLMKDYQEITKTETKKP